MPPLIFPATFWPAVASPSGPTPPISANLARWYSANYGITSSGGVVSQMNDLSGNGQHATQTDSTKQPALTANARKTNSMLTFDGVNDSVTFNGITLTGDFTVYWVGSIEETPANTSAYFAESDTGGAAGTKGLNNFAGGTYWFNGADILQGNDGRVFQTSLDIVCVQRTGSTVTCEINDLDASTCPGNSNPTIGAIGPAYSGYSQMKFGEMLIYTSYHNATDKATVKNALKSTWKYPTLPVSGAALWLDGSRWDTLFTTDTGSTNVTTNAGAIGRWEDLSGNARHATQATAGSRPTWSSPNNGQNGLSVADFNSGRFLYADIPSLANGFTVYAVFKYPSTGSGYYYIIARNFTTSTSSAFGFGTRTSYLFLSQSSAEVSSGATSINTVYGAIAKYDGSHPTGNFRIRVSNASSDATGTMTQSAGSPPAGTGQIGRADNNSAPFNGTIMELVLFDSQRSTGDDTAMKNYLAAKWGITWS